MTRFFHGAAQFWRGGTLVALLVLGGFLYQAYTLPEVYESETLVELMNERGSDASGGASDGLRAAVFDSSTIEQTALDTAPHVQRDAGKPGVSVIERTRRAIDLRHAGEARFLLAFRAGTAVLARRGCESLVAAASKRLAALRPMPSLSPQEEGRLRARVVDERTRELAAFVAQHPELAGKKSESGEAFLGVPGMRPPSTPAPAPTTDSVLPILMQQKTRLEERLTFVEKLELGGADESQDKLPPGDALAKMDRASLQKMLVQVKAAIAARQGAAERARANSPNESPSEGTTLAGDPAAPTPVQVEWQRLVQAVVDAQQQAAQLRDGATTSALHIVRNANTPSWPILPNRRLYALLGVTVGLWTGILWAFARVALGHVRVVNPTQYLPEGLPAFPLEGEAVPAPAEATSDSRLAAAKAALPPPQPPPAHGVSPITTPSPSSGVDSPRAAKKGDALPSFPIDAETAKALDAATSASRLAAAKVVPAASPAAATPGQASDAHAPPAPAAAVPASNAQATPALATPAVPAAVPSVPVVPSSSPAVAAPPAPPAPSASVAAAATPSKATTTPVEAVALAAPRAALPSFPMDAELARAVDEATSGARTASSAPRASDTLPKVIIAPEATQPAISETSPSDANAPMELSARDVIAAPMELSARDVIAESVESGAVPAESMPGDAAAEARRPSRHPSWYADGARPEPRPRKPAPAEEVRVNPQPIAAVGPARIEASPIMGIEAGMSTAASGKQGISVYPPPIAAVPPEPSSGGAMRHGSVSPREGVPSSSGSGHPGRRVTQTLGTPLAMSPSTASGFGWTPPPAFGSHQMPPRESDPPPGLVSIPPPPKSPSHLGPVTPNAGTLSSSRHAPAVQSLPVTPGRAPAARATGPVGDEPSTALAIARPYVARTRSEPPAASSIVSDVPKGWSPHPTLTQLEVSEELTALRDQLYRLAVHECFVVGVSSGPEMAAYKSGVAGRLAWLLAQPGHARVLLMEGDFDHPVVHRLMRIDMPLASGFSEQMRRRMNGTSEGPWTIVRCAPNLYVLAEGLVRSPGLLPTVHFADSVRELRRAYDLIVIDGPAGGMSVDTRAIDGVVDGVVLAGESDLLDRASSWFSKKQLMAVVSAEQPAPRSR
jgi:Mrp family chromosome partitioning ATPase